MKTKSIVEVRNLSVQLGEASILEDVSFDFHTGNLHAILGPNGAGKTTLIRSLLGGMPHLGSIQFHFRQNAAIGYVPQILEFDHTVPLTVHDFLAAQTQRRAVFMGNTRGGRKQIKALLARTGCEHLLRRRVGTLSGGEFQRMMLAQALYPDPELLILDEPASSVDEPGRRHFEQLLRELRDKQGVTIVMVAHHIASTLQLADQVLVLNRRLISSGQAAEIARSAVIEQVFGVTAAHETDSLRPTGSPVSGYGA